MRERRLRAFGKVSDPTRRRRTGSLRNTFQNCRWESEKYLAARNCSIPQASADSRKLNVIRGEFFVKGEISWAALCSARGNSVILVFRNRHDTRPGELAKAPDTNYVGTDEPTRITYEKFAP